jgi:hypothetical protein
MKRIHITLFVLFFLAVGFFAFKNPTVADTVYKDGDLIFQCNPHGQGKAIQLATHSNITHCGIIFIENGEAMVYHAVQPVKKSKLSDFISMGVNDEYWVKRLKNRDTELSADEIVKMKKQAESMQGKNYDIFFNWGDDQIYCSEYLWKIYDRGAGIKVGALKKMKEFDLSSPIVKQIMAQRYGDKIPLEESMIAPGDIFSSSLLEEVIHK